MKNEWKCSPYWFNPLNWNRMPRLSSFFVQQNCVFTLMFGVYLLKDERMKETQREREGESIVLRALYSHFKPDKICKAISSILISFNIHPSLPSRITILFQQLLRNGWDGDWINSLIEVFSRFNEIDTTTHSKLHRTNLIFTRNRCLRHSKYVLDNWRPLFSCDSVLLRSFVYGYFIPLVMVYSKKFIFPKHIHKYTASFSLENSNRIDCHSVCE